MNSVCMMFVQTASDPETRYNALPDDDVGLYFEFDRRLVFLPWRLLRH